MRVKNEVCPSRRCLGGAEVSAGAPHKVAGSHARDLRPGPDVQSLFSLGPITIGHRSPASPGAPVCPGPEVLVACCLSPVGPLLHLPRLPTADARLRSLSGTAVVAGVMPSLGLGQRPVRVGSAGEPTWGAIWNPHAVGCSHRLASPSARWIGGPGAVRRS